MKKRDDLEQVTKTCKVILDGGDVFLDVGSFTLTAPAPGPAISDFADEAYKSARNSFAKLMVPKYRLVVIDGSVRQGFGLDRWIKLVDGREELERRLSGKGARLSVHKKSAA